MISFKCKICGGELSFDTSGGLVCPYCGSKSFFDDSMLDSYKAFRKQMLDYLKSATDEKAESADNFFLWDYCETASFQTADGESVEIQYLFYSEEDDVKAFVARNSVVYVFKRKDANKAEKMRKNLLLLDYPSADTKDLKKCFPTIIHDTRLSDESTLIAISKPENVYPLYAFGNLRYEHVAWIVSRLENICCVLEYSDVIHGGITTDSVFINPHTHEGMLYGNWWMARRKNPMEISRDLLDLRTVASKLLGPYQSAIPPLFASFLKHAPANNAYDDFARWDDVIERGMGGHKFTKFSNS